MSRSSDDRERALRRARSDPRQLWLPHVDGAPPAESHESCPVQSGQRTPKKKRGVLLWASQTPEAVRQRFALELELHRFEVAADGGDGSVCSTDECDTPTLDLEWMLRGALLEAMAAVLLRAVPACPNDPRQSEDSIESAEYGRLGMHGADPGHSRSAACSGARRSCVLSAGTSGNSSTTPGGERS